MIEKFLERFAGFEKNKIAIAGADEKSVLEAVKSALLFSVAEFFLVGNKERIKEISSQIDLNINSIEIVSAADDVECARTAVKLVKDGKASAVMKGRVETSTILKAVLDRENGLRGERKLSHLAMFFPSSYHKPLFVTDAALNISPSFEEKRDIILNAARAVAALGIKKPKIALICAKEHVDEKMPVTLEYAKLVEQNNSGEIDGCIIGGPFALDNAVSMEAAKTKGITSEVAGDADIVFCPEIVSANILYKALTIFARAHVGGVIIGANAPIILTSRADSAENKLISIALGGALGAGGSSVK